MKIEEFRGKKIEEIVVDIASMKKELFNLRFQVASGELENTSRFKLVRRAIARANTVVTELKNKAG